MDELPAAGCEVAMMNPQQAIIIARNFQARLSGAGFSLRGLYGFTIRQFYDAE
ncbi:MAG TPA: hypothetical protein VJR23_16010 [Candidatus Acidoferrales bacterium]|nr:hypothetical protein [Candidatus Acidoferrales bacterium]